MTISLYNTLTRQKDALVPEDKGNVRMYVCGPTVYDRAHLGNARSVVVYDVLYRLLRHVYGEKQVTYVRNITDVDDKINKAAVERGITIQALTKEVIDWFHDDMAALNCLRPTEEPKATEHIPHMIEMIETLIQNGHAYVAEGHVLFDVASDKNYGILSGRSLDDLIAGARVEVAPYKKSPGDFVLWKPAAATDDASSKFESPWGVGRPGWHIECSAMATELLGDNFDIHGGGADLMFPHHENEIAQACAANPGSHFAKVWVHNGFLTVGGEKMSKSLGNFTTVRDLLEKGVHGEVIRFALLSTHYRKPLDWTEKLVDDAKKQLDYWYRVKLVCDEKGYKLDNSNKGFGALDSLKDDLNLPHALSEIHALFQIASRVIDAANAKVENWDKTDLESFIIAAVQAANFLGLLQENSASWFKGEASEDGGNIEARIEARKAAKKAKNWAEADRIRDELKAEGILLEDKPGDVTEWRRL